MDKPLSELDSAEHYNGPKERLQVSWGKLMLFPHAFTRKAKNAQGVKFREFLKTPAQAVFIVIFQFSPCDYANAIQETREFKGF